MHELQYVPGLIWMLLAFIALILLLCALEAGAEKRQRRTREKRANIWRVETQRRDAENRAWSELLHPSLSQKFPPLSSMQRASDAAQIPMGTLPNPSDN